MSKNWDNIFKSLAQRRAPTEEYKTTYDENTVTPADKQSFREWSNQDSFSSMQAKLTPPLKDALYMFSRTGFFVVARIGLTGAANGLFIIHDKFPANYEEDFRPDVPEKETGILAYEDVAEISMAGLDGSCLLEDRNFSTPISWIGKVQSPIELVYVRQRTAGQGLVRLTVFDDFGGVDLEYD
ncbi:hypothetical protein BKA80DRAFT_311002 [Phyllosticta citrichinensis]